MRRGGWPNNFLFTARFFQDQAATWRLSAVPPEDRPDTLCATPTSSATPGSGSSPRPLFTFMIPSCFPTRCTWEHSYASFPLPSIGQHAPRWCWR